MEKFDLNFASDDPRFDNVAVFEAIARVRQQWKRNSRKILFNHKSAQQ
jgi:hypothetical protein